MRTAEPANPMLAGAVPCTAVSDLQPFQLFGSPWPDMKGEAEKLLSEIEAATMRQIEIGRPSRNNHPVHRACAALSTTASRCRDLIEETQIDACPRASISPGPDGVSVRRRAQSCKLKGFSMTLSVGGTAVGTYA